MSNGRTLLVVGIILAVFGALAVAGGPALTPGETTDQTPEIGVDSDTDTDDSDDSGDSDDTDEPDDSDDTDESDDQLSGTEVVQECAAESPDDYADPDGGNGDVVGWVDGYWYDEPIDIEAEGGITEDELQVLSARTAARFEAMRCITADEGIPPVEIQSREEFQEEQSGLFEDTPRTDRLFDNAMLSTLMFVDTETDAVEQRESNRGVTVGGTYNFVEDEIVIVSDNPENLLIDEAVLAHELGHAIQDQQFNLSQYERPTTDRDKGVLGLIEGDVHLIEQRYLAACQAGEWEEECVTTETEGGQGDLADLNWGLYFQNFQPYSDGPAFVEHFENEGGWEAVNELYENPPTSAIQLVNPDQFPEPQPEDFDVPDESTDDWDRLQPSFGPNYDEIGIAGISAMFATPLYESQGIVSIYEQEEFLNPEDSLSPLNYTQPETDGWRGDRMYAYSGEGNATGTVWEIEWDEPADWEPFVESYKEMIEYREGEAVGNRTYTFKEGSGYEMAVTIETEGDRVTIVTAPSVDELDEIHDIETPTGS